ncbi:MAG: hypothetical protein NTY14_05835 [Candidatus Omnitrophica bacterium]|nr:hypothetical protein [Candidatus Omnitrophota bacterium]
MRNVNICLGVILALILLYSNPAFAGNHENESLGAQGLFTSGEMHAVTRAGGTFAPSQSNSNHAAPLARFTTTNENGQTVNVDRTAHQLRKDIGDSFRNTAAGQAMRATAAQARTDHTSKDSYFGGRRGHSDALGSAVGQLRAKYSGNRQTGPGQYKVGGYDVIDEGAGFMGKTNSYKTGPGQYKVGGYDVIDEGSVPFMGPTATNKVNTPPAAGYKNPVIFNVATNTNTVTIGKNNYPVRGGKADIGANIYMPVALLRSVDQLKGAMNSSPRNVSAGTRIPAATDPLPKSFFSNNRFR